MSSIFQNHVGYLPLGSKFFVVTDPPSREFLIRSWGLSRSSEVVFRGVLQEISQDLGPAFVGCFSEVQNEGFYTIECGSLSSRPVIIHRTIYDYPLRTLLNYFASQRCGDSSTGYNTPCHLHDARRIDNGEQVDVTGGWHQSCDLRKWMLGTPFGLVGLVALGRRFATAPWNRGGIEEEIRWGNEYFLKMIRPDGGLMDHVILPLGWEGVRDLYPNDAPLPAFYLVIVGEALLASFFHKSDPAYANTCLQAATKLWNYLQASDTHKTAYNPPTIPPNHDFLKNWFDQHFLGSSFAVGDSLFASTLFYRATGDRHWLEIAIEQANALVALQFGGDVQENPLAACFRVAQGQDEVASGTYYGVFGPIALCDILDILPNHADSVRWRDAIRRIADQCLIMSGRNAWGLIPSYWYRTDPGHGRPIGDGYYKYYYCHSGLHIGVNNEILAKAIFLLRARKILGDQRLLDLACRQFDWVVGCNPFDQSSIEGVGYNQGVRLMGEFIPPTPQIPGAVMTGIAGNAHDNPVKQISVSNEYDIPPTSLLMWFLSELTAEESGLEPSSCVCGERR